MPELEYAFLADAADARPGQKFAVIGGGVSRLGGPTFPLRHPHLALVVGLAVAAGEIGRETELRFAIVTPAGADLAGAQATVVPGGQGNGRGTVLTFALDLWNLSFPVPGDYSIRITIDGDERKRLPLIVDQRAAEQRRRPTASPGPVRPPFPPPPGKA
jgi:hypothetical protein